MQEPEHREPWRFTLIQLFVVTGLVGTVLGLFLSAIGAAREASRKMSCSNNLKRLGLALHTYHDTYNMLPPNGLYFTTAQSGNPYVGKRTSRGSVFAKLQPFVESSSFYNQLNFEDAAKPWGFEQQPVRHWSPKGTKPKSAIPAHSFFVPSYYCPSSGLDRFLDRGPTAPAISCYAPSMGSQRMPGHRGWCLDYQGNVFDTGPAPVALTVRGSEVSGVFAKGHWAAKFRDIFDGQSQVISMGEILPHKSQAQSLGWLHAYAFPAATTGPINFPVIGIGERKFPGPGGCHHYQNRQTSDAFRSRHKGGAQFVLCDGSTQFISETIDYLTYQRLGDRRDGQPLGGNWNPPAD